MKRVLLSLVAVLTACTTTMCFPVSAASTKTQVTNESVPIEAKEYSEQTGQDIVYHEPGCFTVGKTIFIDVNTYKTDGSIYNMDDIYNNANNDFTKTVDSATGIKPDGATPPSDTTVWSWSNGVYTGDFTMSQRVFTNYRFTGYSSYYVHVNVGQDPNQKTSGAFGVTAIRDDNSEGASYPAPAGTYDAHIVFTGCKASERLAFAVNKANDGYSVDGEIQVYYSYI